MAFMLLAIGALNVYAIADGSGNAWNWVAAVVMFGLFFEDLARTRRT